MAAITTIVAGVALAATAAGAYKQYQASKAAQRAQEQQIAAQQRAERLRERQMELDAARKRREVIRNMVLARSTALSNITAAGVNTGSSALAGAEAGIMGQGGGQIQAVNQNQLIGAGMFDANADRAAGEIAEGRARGDAAFGQVLTSIGGSLLTNMGAIERVGNTLFAPSAPTTGWDATVYRN